MKLLSTIACGALLSIPAVAMATDLAPLDVPAKALPAPTADISPGMQAFVGRAAQSQLEQAVEDRRRGARVR